MQNWVSANLTRYWWSKCKATILRFSDFLSVAGPRDGKIRGVMFKIKFIKWLFYSAVYNSGLKTYFQYWCFAILKHWLSEHFRVVFFQAIILHFHCHRHLLPSSRAFVVNGNRKMPNAPAALLFGYYWPCYCHSIIVC